MLYIGEEETECFLLEVVAILVAVCFVATRPRDRCDASIGGTTVANRARAWLSWLIGLDADLGTSCIRPTAPENAAVLEAHIINTSNTLAVSDSLSPRIFSLLFIFLYSILLVGFSRCILCNGT